MTLYARLASFSLLSTYFTGAAMAADIHSPWPSDLKKFVQGLWLSEWNAESVEIIGSDVTLKTTDQRSGGIYKDGAGKRIAIIGEVDQTRGDQYHRFIKATCFDGTSNWQAYDCGLMLNNPPHGRKQPQRITLTIKTRYWRAKDVDPEMNAHRTSASANDAVTASAEEAARNRASDRPIRSAGVEDADRAEQQRIAELNERMKARNDAINAQSEAAKAKYEQELAQHQAKLARVKAAEQRYALDKAAHDAAMQSNRQAQAEYQMKLAALAEQSGSIGRAKIGPRPPRGQRNCDPGPCSRMKLPPPPPRFEDASGEGESGTATHVVYVDLKRCDGTYGKTDAEALATIARLGGGNWVKRFEIRRRGYASLWCVYRPGIPNEYGFVDGAASAGDASRIARSKALVIAGGKASLLRWAEAWKF